MSVHLDELVVTRRARVPHRIGKACPAQAQCAVHTAIGAAVVMELSFETVSQLMAMATSYRKRTAARDDQGDRHVRRKTCDLDFDTLECPICTRILSPPAVQCSNGHTICASCCVKLPKKVCPSCALPIGSSRNIAVEKIIESLQVACKHAARGCREKLPCPKIAEHEEDCVFRCFRCPLVGCIFECYGVQIEPHFVKTHNAHVCKLDNGRLLKDLRRHANSPRPKYNIVQGGKGSGMFLLHYQFDKALQRVNFFCSSFGHCSRTYSLSIEVDKQGTKHSCSIEAPVSDNQFDKDWLTKMEQQSDFLSVYENPGPYDKSRTMVFKVDLKVF